MEFQQIKTTQLDNVPQHIQWSIAAGCKDAVRHRVGVLPVFISEDAEVNQKFNVYLSLDVSNSMNRPAKDGDKSALEYAKITLKHCIKYLSSKTELEIKLTLTTFNQAVEKLFEAVLTPEIVPSLIDMVDSIVASGQTNLFEAMNAAADVHDASRKNVMLLLTDGAPTTGFEKFNDIMDNLDSKVSDFECNFIGFGLFAAEKLLFSLAQRLHGEFHYVNDMELAGYIYGEIFNSILNRCYEKIQYSCEDPNVRFINLRSGQAGERYTERGYFVGESNSVLLRIHEDVGAFTITVDAIEVTTGEKVTQLINVEPVEPETNINMTLQCWRIAITYMMAHYIKRIIRSSLQVDWGKIKHKNFHDRPLMPIAVKDFVKGEQRKVEDMFIMYSGWMKENNVVDVDLATDLLIDINCLRYEVYNFCSPFLTSARHNSFTSVFILSRFLSQSRNRAVSIMMDYSDIVMGSVYCGTTIHTGHVRRRSARSKKRKSKHRAVSHSSAQIEVVTEDDENMSSEEEQEIDVVAALGIPTSGIRLKFHSSKQQAVMEQIQMGDF
ncbi:hypothetical protein PCE1_000286 [Barthelona sp. PCE]